MISAKARDLWESYLAETDETAAEMLYREYLHALVDGTRDDDDFAAALPIGVKT